MRGELPCQRAVVAVGGLVHEQGHARGVLGRAQQHGDRRREVVGVRGFRASTRARSARISGNARAQAGCARQRAIWASSARSALRPESSYTGMLASDAPSSVAVRTERGNRRR